MLRLRSREVRGLLVEREVDRSRVLAGLLGATLCAVAASSEPYKITEARLTVGGLSAFVDPETPPDAPDRWSIEVRCAVIYA